MKSKLEQIVAESRGLIHQERTQAAMDAYEDSLVRGLCECGAAEAARRVMDEQDPGEMEKTRPENASKPS